MKSLKEKTISSKKIYKGNLLEPAIKVPFIYLPKLEDGEQRKIEWKNPVGLTELFNKVLKVYRKKNSTALVKEWCRNQKGAVVEFGKERAFLQNGCKVVLNRDGEVLWATKPSIDSNEIENIANKNILEMPEWKQILKWANRVNKKRNNQLIARKDYS